MKHNWENYFDISSEYWEKVEKIYEDSESFPKKVVKDRNLHHKFPRSFSKKDGVDIDNDDDNLVSLSLADHFRVHYYLWKCAKKGYRSMMAMAFTLMRKKAVVYATDETIEQIAKDYESAMREVAEAKKGKKMSEESKKKNREAHKGKRIGEDNPFYGKHHSEETRKKLSDSWDYDKHFTEETRKKISEANTGKKFSEEHKKKIGAANKGEKNPMYGKHFSEGHKKKLREARKGKTPNKGMHWYNNGKINKLCYECPPGFVPGRIK